jgi:hypothetical protein
LHYMTRSGDRPHARWCSSRKWQIIAVK